MTVRYRCLYFYFLFTFSGVSFSDLADAQVAIDPPLEPSEAHTEWRRIAIKHDPGDPCPKPPAAWQVRHLFGTTAMPPPSLPTTLALYCVYTYTAGPVTSSVLSAFRTALDPPTTAALDPDTMAVVPQGDVLAARLGPALRARFLAQAGAVGVPSGTGSVRLAIVDTSPSDGANPENGPENSPHGTTLRRFAEEFLCAASGSCAATLRRRLALAYLEHDRYEAVKAIRDEVHGGHVGTIGDLAEALYSELEAWKSAGMGDRLVINLSVGWDGAFFGGLEPQEEDMPAPVRAVFDVLDHAICEGAVVIAAAGNRGDDRSSSGPLLPGGWERRFPTCPSGGYLPRVWAVAGLGPSDKALLNARSSAQAPLVAWGDHAVTVSHPNRGEPTATLTGSSVSTLVVSAAAAAVWHLLPHLTAQEVMDGIYTASSPLPRPPDFCLGGDPLVDGCPNPDQGSRPQVRRVAFCSVLTAICQVRGGCPPIPPCPSSSGFHPVPDDLGGWPEIDAVAIVAMSSPNEVCEGADPLYHPLFDEPDHPCPTRQFHGLAKRAWNRPQPGVVPCPNCKYSRTKKTLIVEIPSDFAGELSHPTLEACGEARSLAPGSSVLRATDGLRVKNLFLGDCEEIRLSFRVKGRGSAFSTVVVMDD